MNLFDQWLICVGLLSPFLVWYGLRFICRWIVILGIPLSPSCVPWVLAIALGR
jgi:hypothetical protein